MPAPQPLASPALHGLSSTMPSSERARGTHWPGFQITPKSQPRFDCSMPYSAATDAFFTPGGKCTPLMKRTVRDDSGAWLLLKRAAASCSLAHGDFRRATAEEGPSSFSWSSLDLVRERRRVVGEDERVAFPELHVGDALSSGLAEERAVGGVLVDGVDFPVLDHD